MSELYNSIPPEDLNTYEKRAAEVAREAQIEVAAELLGPSVVRQAETLTHLDAHRGELADNVETYVHEHDIHEAFIKSLDAPIESIGDEAERYVNFTADAYAAAAPNRAALKYRTLKATSQQELDALKEQYALHPESFEPTDEERLSLDQKPEESDET